MMRACKSVTQKTVPNTDLENLMSTFTEMVNLCIKIGLRENTHNMKRLSGFCYHELRNYDIMSTYKLCAISQAAGILSNRNQSIKRGRKVNDPVVRKPFVTNCYGVRHNGCLLTIPYQNRNPVNIILNEHTQKMLSDPSLTMRSFTLTADSISICVSRETEEIQCTGTVRIDRNLRNVTCGNGKLVTFYKINKILSIRENSIHAGAGFRRKKKQFWKERQGRIAKRIKQYLHRISKHIVDNAVREKSIILMENLNGTRKLYGKGNGQGNKYRRRMNGWPHYELQRQIEYKAIWAGLPVEFVDPRRTSTQCPGCGKRLQGDTEHRRKMLCANCGLFMDRDVVAAMNISRKLSTRFRDSRGDTGKAQSGSFEPAMTEPRTPVIRIVDVSKSSYGKQLSVA